MSNTAFAQFLLALFGAYVLAFSVAYPGDCPRWGRLAGGALGVVCVAPGFWRVFSLAWGF